MQLLIFGFYKYNILEDYPPQVNKNYIAPVIYYVQTPIQPKKARKPYPSFGAAMGLLGILLGFSVVGGVILGLLVTLFPDILAPGFMVVYIGSFILVLWLGIIFRRSSKFSAKGGSWYLWPMLILFTLLFVMVREPMIYLWQSWEGADKDTLSGLDTLNPYIVIVTVIAAPVFEELIFRGIILDGFLKRYKPRTAIFLSSLIFGIAHLNLPQFLNALLLGILMGWVYWKTKSLLLTILIHFINNLSATLLDFYNSKYCESMVRHFAGNTRTYLLIYFVSLIFAGLLFFVFTMVFAKPKVNFSAVEITDEENTTQSS
jgi:uncharacterized protein